VRVVGEGGNLGVTQRGRIEFARTGGRINTDAIDNSAGVDTSDHEVNIKIGLAQRLAEGRLDETVRRHLLEAMTDDVAASVLRDNTAQNRVLGVARHRAPAMLATHARIIDELVDQGRLDRDLEHLPSPRELDRRLAAGEGMCGPELSVLLAYVKSQLTSAMIGSELPDDPAYCGTLGEYFPPSMRDHLGDVGVGQHPLAREIISTHTVNAMVNQAGISYAFRLTEELSATSEDAIRSHTVTNAVFGLDALWADIARLDNEVPADCQANLVVKSRRLLDRSARWFLTRRPQPLDIGAEIARYAEPVARLMSLVPGLLCGIEARNAREFVETLRSAGAPDDIASRVAHSLYGFGLLNIVDIAAQSGRDLIECAALYYAVSAHLGFDRLLFAVTTLERETRWHALARQAARDDLYQSLKLITTDVLSISTPGQDRFAAIDCWERHNSARLIRARKALGELAALPEGDLAVVSVVAREVRSMIR
jgi:glutamate dehydrogenase